MADGRSGGARWAAAWGARLGVTWGCAVGAGLLLAWPAFVLRTGGHKAWWYAVVVAGVIVLVAVTLGAGIAVGGREESRAATTVATLLLGVAGLACWGVALGIQSGAVDQRILHDRGAAVNAVVVGHRNSDVQPGPPAGIDVRLADGTRLFVKGAQPPVGSAVVVTRDPHGQAPPRLGPPPGAPRQSPAPLLCGFAACGTLLSLLAVGSPSGPRRPAPADGRPATS